METQTKRRIRESLALSDIAPPAIVLLTDFGVRDPYVGVMKCVILSTCPQATIIDLTHGVTPQSVSEARFVLGNALPFIPSGAIVCAVVDPGVGSPRRAIALKTTNNLFVGPDNGLFTDLVQREATSIAVVLNTPDGQASRPSQTFHGRDIFAPAAAHLAQGVDIRSLGTEIPVPDLIRLPDRVAGVRADQGGVIGQVVYIDGYGNLVTSITEPYLDEAHRFVTIAGRTGMIPMKNYYAAVAVHEPVAYLGSYGRLEVALRNGNAADHYEVKIGHQVRLVTQAP
jgi:S-adenosylmethionine hydrolase